MPTDRYPKGPVTKRPLKDIADIQIGYQLPSRIPQDPDAAYRIVRMRDISDDGELRSERMALFTPQRDAGRYVVGDGDVVFQARGSRNLAFVLRDVPPMTLVSNHFYVLRARPSTTLPEYLAWFINQPSARGRLAGRVQGTTMMLVPRKALESLEVVLPPLDIQRAVVTLADLRQKERMLSQNLESQRDRLIWMLSLRAVTRA